MLVLYWAIVLLVAVPTFVLMVAAWRQEKYPQAVALTAALIGVGLLLGVVTP